MKPVTLRHMVIRDKHIKMFRFKKGQGFFSAGIAFLGKSLKTQFAVNPLKMR
jgi:hypothetical protein